MQSMSEKIVSRAMCQGVGARQEHKRKNVEHGKSTRALYHPADPADCIPCFLILQAAAIYYLISRKNWMKGRENQRN